MNPTVKPHLAQVVTPYLTYVDVGRQRRLYLALSCLALRCLQVDVRRERSLTSALEEMRAKLVLCMRRGYHLVLMLGNAAPHVRRRAATAHPN